MPNYPSPFPLPPSPFVAGSQDQCGLSKAATRFWGKVSQGVGSDPCWIWNASKSKSGYGQFWDGVTMVRSHRWSWEHLRGEIPSGLECDHLCRNRACVNPWHLDLVSHHVNMGRRPVTPMVHTPEARALMSRRATERWALKRGRA